MDETQRAWLDGDVRLAPFLLRRGAAADQAGLVSQRSHDAGQRLFVALAMSRSMSETGLVPGSGKYRAVCRPFSTVTPTPAEVSAVTSATASVDQAIHPQPIVPEVTFEHRRDLRAGGDPALLQPEAE